MEPLPPLPRKGLASVTKWRRSQNEKGEEERKKEEKKGEKKQSQKGYMVSGSLCPLISFLDVSFSVSFVVRGQRPRRGR